MPVAAREGPDGTLLPSKAVIRETICITQKRVCGLTPELSCERAK